MSKITLSDVTNLQNEGSAVSTMAANNVAITAAVENTLSRDGTAPNQMLADLDMNGHRILNLPLPITGTEPITGDALTLKAVRYDMAQTLTDIQKQQARENIGATAGAGGGGGGGGSGVTSFNTRDGLVVSAAGDYTATQITYTPTGTIAAVNVQTAIDEVASETQTSLGLKADLASPALTGNPTAPTQAGGNNSTRLATTAYVQGELPVKANLASPTFTGVPVAPTAAVDTNTTQLATTAFVVAQAASATPLDLGTAAVGTSLRYARADHVHNTVTAIVPGALYGLKLGTNVTDAANDIDIAVGNATDATNTVNMALTGALVKQIDATWVVGTNQGMRASGAAVANTTYHIFLIRRTDTGVVDVAADTSATGANITANTNANYTQFRRIGSITRFSAANSGFVQYGNTFQRFLPAFDIAANNSGTSAVTRTLSVPIGIVVEPILTVRAAYAGTAQVNPSETVYISSLTQTDNPANTCAQVGQTLSVLGATNVFTTGMSPFRGAFTNTSAQIRSRLSDGTTASTLTIVTLGWIDDRGISGP